MTKDQTTTMFEAWVRAESRVPYDSTDSRRQAMALATVLLRGAPMPRWTDAGGREFWQFVAEHAMREAEAAQQKLHYAVEDLKQARKP